MSRRGVAVARTRHRIVERHHVPMHEDQFRDPNDAREDDRRRFLGGDSDGEFASEDEEFVSRRARAYGRLSMKTKVLGPLLFTIGFVMLLVYALYAVGVVEFAENAERGTSTALLAVGSMCALGGGYSTLVMVMVWRGESGWSYGMIPGE